MANHYIKKIEQINFGLMSPEDIRKMSVVTVEYPDTYGGDGFPIEKGLMDPRLGIIDPSLVCRTCGFKGGDCQGHFGSIELARPVIHVGFGDVIHKILRSTCNECGRILLNDEQIEYFTTKINEAMENKESINSILKEVYINAKRELYRFPRYDEEVDLKHCCPHCGAPQEAIILNPPVTIRQGDYKLTPSEVRERLEKITDDDAFVLGVNPEVARPEWLVLTVLPVPPVTIRPSITLDTGERSEDDLTHKLVDILRINQRLLENMEAGAPQLIVEDLWELLQYHVTTYFDNEASGVPPARHRSGRPLKTLTQRLKGKEGRFRSNLSGKRVNFSARTVISPDPNISINEVGVPEMIAKEVTVPVHVNDWNIEDIKKYINNGPDVHPGANYVINGNTKRRITEETKEFIIDNLEPGYIVERHLKDGDMVLFNRQPSLHRMSMMAHEVRVLPYKTFRLNLCVCPPYNADFDGDEMNMHIFQTDESRAEAKSLMRVQEHILSPRFGGPIIGAIHDHISGAYLLTRDGVEFTEEEALQIIRKSHLAIPPFKSGQWILKHDPDFGEESYIFKDKGDKWTGKELFSLLLPNDLNLSYSAEISKCPVVYPVEDATVVIKNGILEQGVIDESAYGSFSGKILDKIVKEYGPGRAREFLDRSTDLAIIAITKFGITASLNDMEIPQEAQDRINNHLDKKMAEVDKLVESYEEGYLQALPGRSLEETLEMRIMQVLGEARDMSGSIAENYLTMGKQYPEDPYDHVMAVENHSVVMARTGARASMLNLTQITACVGQQAVRGGRIERGYLNRTLPHFKKGEIGAESKGFVKSRYREGLTPIEFFFHAMGGREGLVDTAIRTALSGYMQRRLVNALQDLQVKPSGLVTDNQGNVIQTMFGEDGVDPAKSDFGKPADLNKLIDEIKIEMGTNNLGKNQISFSDRNVVKSRIKNDINKFKDISNKISYLIYYIGEYVENPLFRSNLENIHVTLVNFKNNVNNQSDKLAELLPQVEKTKSKNKLKNIYPAGSKNNLLKTYTNKLKKFETDIAEIVKTINESKINLEVLNNILDDVNSYSFEFIELKNIIDYEINDLKYIRTDYHEELMDMKKNLIDLFNVTSEKINNKLAELDQFIDTIQKDMNNLEFKNIPSFKEELDNLSEFDNLLRDELDKKLNESNDVRIIISNKLKEYGYDYNQSKIIAKIKVNKLQEYHKLYSEDIISLNEFNNLKKELIYN